MTSGAQRRTQTGDEGFRPGRVERMLRQLRGAIKGLGMNRTGKERAEREGRRGSPRAQGRKSFRQT